MAKRWLALMTTALLVAAACAAPGDTPAPGTPAPATPAPGTDAPATPEPGMTAEPGMTPDISGTLRVAGWSAGDVEDGILRNVLDEFEAMYPGVTVEFDVVAGEYPAIVLTRLGAGDYPDLFYVNQAFSQDWIDQGVLADLNERAQTAGFSLDNFFPSFLSPFQQNGATYAFPKDASMLGMQTNDSMLADAGVSIPTTTDELVAAAQALKDNGVETPMCFAAEWQRAGAFVHGFGGGLVDDNGAPAIDSAESRAGLQWYLDQYQNGLAARASDIGADWCGAAFGTEAVAIAFEGNWIGPFMEQNYPDVAYTVSPIPAGPAGQATLSFTVGYGMHPNTPNPEASWALLTYLTGQQGMQEWVNGGLVLPARDDVNPTSDLQQQYAAFAEFATAGEGVTPQWPRVSDAFNGALGAASEPGGTVDQIVNATQPVLQEVTGQ
ncbi:MAG TPA: sugar ABC transporter substrate-binding protein [Euzebya sp.]|nr:sugar ABC transporter substrate-binding protein [Euzebya sp.]